MQELFYALWGTLLAPIIVALVVTTYSYWLNNKNKNKQEKGRAATRPFFWLYCR
ncbi:MAG: type I toxin-antitoxin system Fst family toxin [Veillonella parvula]|uniref:type I toxin-antitoxin system Fst family toxin n=1 Tax=Veillonella parvula TaxID=29466 RepID=UPI00399463DC